MPLLTDDFAKIAEQAAREAVARAEQRAAKRAEREETREERRHQWAIDHATELEERRQVRAAEKEEKRERWVAEHPQSHETSDDRFIREMAERRGITPDEFRAIQESNRREMARMKGLGSIEEQTKRAPSVNPVKES